MSSLDEDEKKLLYVEQLTDGSIIPIQHISTYANMFRELNGRLPINGVELVPMLQSERGRSRFQELSRAEQYAQCHFAVNKLTGHFYADFDSNWKAGGVSLRAVASEGYMTDSGLSDIAPNVHSLPVRIIDPDTGVLAENVTEITFFGDDPEEVLYRDWAFGATEDAPEGGIGGDRK